MDAKTTTITIRFIGIRPRRKTGVMSEDASFSMEQETTMVEAVQEEPAQPKKRGGKGAAKKAGKKIKGKTEGATPTQIAFFEVTFSEGQPPVVSSEISFVEIGDATSELDFVKGQCPVDWRRALKEEDLSLVPSHHQVWQKCKKGEDAVDLAQRYCVKTEGKGKKISYVLTIPSAYIGLRPHDLVAMAYGGSGDRFAFALGNKLAKLNEAADLLSGVYRITPAILKNQRELRGQTKDHDSVLLAQLLFAAYQNDFSGPNGLFHKMLPRDYQLILLRAAYEARDDAMKARIACEQRLQIREEGQVFLSVEGEYPEGSIEDVAAAAKANDRILAALQQEEAQREKDLLAAVEMLPVYQQILSGVKGCASKIGARLIVAAGNPGRFSTEAQFRAYMGCHVKSGGKYANIPPELSFPCRKNCRNGEARNWQQVGRQGLFLLADQFNRRPESFWGTMLRINKRRLRMRHPEPIQMTTGNGKPYFVYGDGHIHKMALWRTISQFATWWFREWRRMEKDPENYIFSNYRSPFIQEQDGKFVEVDVNGQPVTNDVCAV